MKLFQHSMQRNHLQYQPLNDMKQSKKELPLKKKVSYFGEDRKAQRFWSLLMGTEIFLNIYCSVYIE